LRGNKAHPGRGLLIAENRPARAGFTFAFDRFYTQGFGTFGASTAAQPSAGLLSTRLSLSLPLV